MNINDLCYDVLDLIIRNTNNHYCAIVCNKWFNIINDNSIICTTCNKLIKMYDIELWDNYENDYDKLIMIGRRCLLNDSQYFTKFDADISGQPIQCIREYTHFVDAIYYINNELCHIWPPLGDPTLMMVSKHINKYEFIESILKDWKSFKNFTKTEKLCLSAVKLNGFCLKYIIEQTENICLAAVKNNGYALLFVSRQTENICLEAVKTYGLALQYVKVQTENICLEAVKNKGCALQYVHNQTENICLAAVMNNGLALQYVLEQTDNICLAAIINNGASLKYVHDQTENICVEAVRNNRIALKYINDQNIKYICRKVKTDREPLYIPEHYYYKYYNGYKPKKVKK